MRREKTRIVSAATRGFERMPKQRGCHGDGHEYRNENGDRRVSAR
jgi:hypothetical protein